MWIIARYLPVAPFSLKPASATASGGKTLLVPTPYSIKMAMLDVAIRTRGIAEGERLFPLLRDLKVWFEAPHDVVVIKGFGKIQRLLKDRSNVEKAQEAQTRGHFPMQPTIAYREYAYYRDPFRLAFLVPDEGSLNSELPLLLSCINYFGRRGGFVQIMEQARLEEQLPTGHFFALNADGLQPFSNTGTLQMLDDCGSTLTFQRANIYTPERITVGKERIMHHVVLPYQLKRSSRSYSWYEYIDEGQ
jgi:hypothetical protein